MRRPQAGHADQLEEYNREFHVALISGCNSRWLLHFHGMMYDQSLRYRMLAFRVKDFPREQSRREHKQILDAALARDVETLVAVLGTHITKGAEMYAEYETPGPERPPQRKSSNDENIGDHVTKPCNMTIRDRSDEDGAVRFQEPPDRSGRVAVRHESEWQVASTRRKQAKREESNEENDRSRLRFASRPSPPASCAAGRTGEASPIVVEISGGGAVSGSNFRERHRARGRRRSTPRAALLGKQDRSHALRHAEQPRRRARAGAEGARRRALCAARAGLLRLRQGDAGARASRPRSPQIIGGEAADLITQQGNPYMFRTSFGQQFAMPKIANYMRDGVKAKTVAVIWVNNDFGKGGRDNFIKEMPARGIKIVADISTEIRPGRFRRRRREAEGRERRRDVHLYATRKKTPASCARCASRASRCR